MVQEIFFELIEDEKEGAAQGVRARGDKIVQRQIEIERERFAENRLSCRVRALFERGQKVFVLPRAKDNDGKARRLAKRGDGAGK